MRYNVCFLKLVGFGFICYAVINNYYTASAVALTDFLHLQNTFTLIIIVNNITKPLNKINKMQIN